MAKYFDSASTIVAISTPAGVGAIGVIRVSGAEAYPILSSFFRAHSLRVRDLAPRRTYYGQFVGRNGEIIDDVCAVFLKTPKSFTGEDMVEFSCHGNPIILNSIVREIIAYHNCRLAEAGEFSFRAFGNGKIDLVQAEALAQVIGATNERALEVAKRCFRGELREKAFEIRDLLKNALVLLEAELEFSDDIDEKPSLVAAEVLSGIKLTLELSLGTYNRDRFLFKEPVAVLLGKPNVGKSSLLNRVSGEDYAIVTGTPGTTRDAISTNIVVDGFKIRLVDTAGYRHATDEIECLGIDKALRAADEADVIIVVLDSSEPMDVLDYELLERTSGKKRIVIRNKSDLPCRWEATFPSLEVSARCGVNIDGLKEKLRRELVGNSEVVGETVIFNVRQEMALGETLRAVERSLAGLRSGLYLDAVVEDVRAAVGELEFLTGEIRSDEVLDGIFSQFCIGK